MAHEKLQPEFTFDDDKINQLKQIVPECFEDGKINFETLRQNLGDWAQDEDDDTLEHFGLFWPGKKEARKLAAIPSEGTFEPVYGEGLKPDGTPDNDGKNDSKNIFIEGENLEVLKILQKSYANRIKMIYIDPPYNTGNDFVYDDDFTEPLQEYLRRTGQIDEEGKPLTTNKRSDGRFHSKWLSMMYPRLRLARNLLKEDGAIFISIDDNEVHNLRAIMNEVFGEENFISNIVWKRKTGSGSNIDKVFSEHEYVLAYTKNKFLGEKWRVKDDEDGNFKNPDNDDRGPWESCAITAPSKNRNQNQLYQIEVYYDANDDEKIIDKNVIDSFFYHNNLIVFREVDGSSISSEEFDENKGIAYFIRRWAYIPSSMRDIFDDNRVFLKGANIPRYKKFEYEYEGKALRSIYYNEFSTQQGSQELRELFGVDILEYPKPVDLIREFITSTNMEGEIALDFFAGSASTAQAVLESNLDNLDVRFICVQLPELTNEDSIAFSQGYLKVSDIAKERIRRVEKKLNTNSGFINYKLINSSYKTWQDINSTNVSQVELALDEFANSPLKPDWSKNKLLTEIQLLEGFPLDSKLETSNFGKNEVNQISHEDLETKLLICLDDNIEENLISDLKLDSNSIFICLDTAISNQDKLRLSDKGLIKTI
ncbi:site-specific DNA-methyltransferase [Algibacter aquimarinus]|uniref:site-specific DNA-methyltransferase (adenine-specific) n=1 Tax=Algibacter aquimarinus TaxID=1136748 RepID=A0ABP9HIQ1_9FLAO